MYWLVGLMSLAIVGLIVSGILLEFRPNYAPRIRPWYKPAMSVQLLAFIGAQLGLLAFGVSDAMAETAEVAVTVNGSSWPFAALVGAKTRATKSRA